MGISNNSNNVIYNNEWGFLIIVTTSINNTNINVYYVLTGFIKGNLQGEIPDD